MPEVLDIGDGSQDALIVRLRAGGYEGWGECEASPLVSIASWVCPKSHSACKPIQESVLGQRLDSAEDVARIARLVKRNSFDLLQTDHTLSGIDIAMWDLLGKRFETPTWKLLGYKESFAKRPYASALFGDEPQDTLAKARMFREMGYSAAKFGWGPFGKKDLEADVSQLHAAREGLGPDGILLVDAGTAFGDDVEAAAKRLPALRETRAEWFEEPFETGALPAYAALAKRADGVKIAGGEECHYFHMARQMIDSAGISYVQIDAGRIGGITPCKQVADYAVAKGLTYVNHTFTSHLALSASLQPFAGLKGHTISEYPVELKALARDLVKQPIERDANGMIHAPDSPGLGIEVDLETVRKYRVEAEVRVKGQVLYRSPDV